MAVPAAVPGNQVNPGLIMADNWAVGSITELYIYSDGISRGEMAALVGYRDGVTGVLTDGPLVDTLQLLTAKSATLPSATLEVDTDADSPHFDKLRINIPVA
jgi:hypothetical protein